MINYPLQVIIYQRLLQLWKWRVIILGILQLRQFDWSGCIQPGMTASIGWYRFRISKYLFSITSISCFVFLKWMETFWKNHLNKNALPENRTHISNRTGLNVNHCTNDTFKIHGCIIEFYCILKSYIGIISK